MKKNKKSILSIFLQVFILICSIYFIISSIKKIDYSYEFQLDNSFLFFIALTIILMIINWYLEIKKWQILNNEQEMSFITACKSVFVGLLVGHLSPNRIAEPFARAFVLPNQNYLKTAVNATIGSFFQSVPTFVFGLMGLLYFVFFVKIYKFKIILYSTIIVILLVFILFFLFKNKIKKALNRIKEKYFSVISQKSLIIIIKVFWLSLSRYLIFIIQNFMVFRALSIEITFLSVLFVSSTIYFISSFLPTFILVDLGIRGTLSVFLYSFFIVNIKGIIFVTYFVWFVNIVVPMIFALPFVKNLKFNNLETLKPLKLWISKN